MYLLSFPFIHLTTHSDYMISMLTSIECLIQLCCHVLLPFTKTFKIMFIWLFYHCVHGWLLGRTDFRHGQLGRTLNWIWPVQLQMVARLCRQLTRALYVSVDVFNWCFDIFEFFRKTRREDSRHFVKIIIYTSSKYVLIDKHYKRQKYICWNP